MEDRKDGTYQGTYMTERAGQYQLHVLTGEGGALAVVRHLLRTIEHCVSAVAQLPSRQP